MMNENLENRDMVELDDSELEAVTGGRTVIVGDSGKSNVRTGPTWTTGPSACSTGTRKPST